MSQLQRNPSAARRLVLAWSLVIACLGVFTLGERVYTQGGQGNRMWAPKLATVPAGELQEAFRRFVARVRPDDMTAPTWRAGASSLEDAVVGVDS